LHNVFPNHNNPYGFYYIGLYRFAYDLLPLGGAYARQVSEMWDGLGSAESWLETGVDSDMDGLADWWEEYVFGAGNLANGWNDLYPDGSGMLNGQRYMYDVAHGATPANPAGIGVAMAWADFDGDGLPDWWEKIYSLSVTDATGFNGANGDQDGDGLINLYEYLANTDPWRPNTANDPFTTDASADADGDGLMNIEEQVYGTHPMLVDSDDDGFTDAVEAKYGWNPVDSGSPGKRRVLSLDGAAGSFVQVPDESLGIYANRLGLESFTLVARVYPTAAPAGTADLISREVSAGVYNYRLALGSDLRVRAEFRARDNTTDVVLTAPEVFALPLNRWTSVSAVLDVDNRIFRLYIDGVEAAQLPTTHTALPSRDGVEGVTIVGRGFVGYIDDVSVSDSNITHLLYSFDDGTAPGGVAFGSTLPEFAASSQVEDTADRVNVVAPNWSALNWPNRYRAAGTLMGAASLVYFNEDGITEAQIDSDGDGLPDSWEIEYGFDPFNPDSNGNSIPDGMEDTDGDGLTNYYEYLAGTNPRSSSTNGVHFDGERDEDGDGLINSIEQANGTMPNRADTDDDGLTDYEELYGTKPDGSMAIGLSDPLWSLSPFIPRGLSLDGNGAMIVTNQARHALTEWTVAAWIKPAGLAGGTVVARSFSTGKVNYELGVEVDGAELRPYARYSALAVTGSVTTVKVGHTATAPGSILVNGAANQQVRVEPGRWSHVACVYSPADHTLSLYVNGDRVAYRTDAVPLPVATDVRFTANPQLLIGATRRTGATTFQNGFNGMIDDVRIAAYAVDERGVREMMGKQLVIDRSPIIPTNGMTVAKTDAGTAGAPTEAVPNEYLVGLAAGLDEQTLIAKFKTECKVDTIRKLKLANALHVRVQAGQNAGVAVSKMKAEKGVRYVEPNYLLRAFQTTEPNDPRYPELWAMNNTGQNGGVEDADIDAPEAWAISRGSASVLVAVIDTGVDYRHPDLVANMWTNPDEIPNNNIDDDGNGFVDDVYGINAIDGTGDPMDDHGHGTHCAGTIGAVGNNGEGVAGVNWNVKIMALKFLSRFGGGSTADAITCLDYAVAKNAKISNNSWGGYGYSQALYDALARARDAGHLVIAAAGNDANDNDRMPAYPASYDLDNIVSVAATDNQDELAWFSNYGATTVDIAAPGVEILSAAPGGGYQLMDGTSMAAPHVAGAAALILSVDGSLSYSAVAGAIIANGDLIPAADGKTVSGMRLNIGNIITGMSGSGAIRVRALSGWFRFDDGGVTMEDFTLSGEWKNNWMRAGRLVGTATNLHEAAYLSFGDTDGDGLPDWWEEAVGLNPLKAADGVGVLPDGERDDDGDGLTNFSEYRASLARMRRGLRGLNPFLADTDSDGVTDGNEDSDLDGLPNVLEQNAYKTDPGNADTDDDGRTDGAELAARTRPTESASPKSGLALTFSGSPTGNTVVVSDKVNADYTFRHSSPEWTIETWVCPADGMDAGVYPLLTRTVIETGLRNYELGLANGYPYVAFSAPDGSRVECVSGSAIPLNEWTHIAGRFELGGVPDQNHLSILINGLCVAQVRTGFQTPLGAGDVVLGSAGFAGQMLNTRIWRVAEEDVAIFEMMQTELLGGNVGDTSGYLSLTGAGHVKESATTLKPNGESVDMLREDWTLECWVRATSAGRLIARRNQSERTDTDFNYLLEVTDTGVVRARFNMQYGAWTDGGNVWVWVSGEDPDINTMTGEIPVNDGKWHHVAYVRDANFCYLYIDGLLDTKQDRLRIPLIPNMIDDPMNYFQVKATGGPVILGEDLAGSMDEVRIWNRALPTSELKDVSSCNLSGTEEGLVSYFNFDLQLNVTADERSAMRDPELEYGIYIPNATRVTAVNDGAPIAIDPLKSIQGVALVGLFLGNDGGLTLEDRVYRMGLVPFTQERYAGRLNAGVSFEPLAQEFLPEVFIDSDYDGLPDDWELENGLDPYSRDTDRNGVSDYWDDQDGDGLPNYFEWLAGIDPWNPDSDFNGVSDFDDDSDGDGLTNGQEHGYGSHPGLTDTDDDGLSDLDDGYPGSQGAWTTNSLMPKVNRYLSLSGNSYLETPKQARWSSGTNSFTLHLDVKPTELPASGEVAYLAVREVRDNVFNYALQLLDNGLVEALVTAGIDSGYPQDVSVLSAESLPLDEWSTLDLVVDLDRQRVLLLVNGQVSGSTFADLTQLPATSGRSLMRTYFGVGLVGEMDNIAFYQEAVSEENLRLIREDKNGLLAYATPALSGCYLFDDGTNSDGVSGVFGQERGQVQDFACLFWSAADQTAARFAVSDWLTGWQNAGSLVGYDWEILANEVDEDWDDDGLPNDWEMKYGFNPADAAGENGALGDMDHDGLSNLAEYQIAEVYGFFPDMNPTLYSTTQGVSDYFLKVGHLYLGEMFADHDFIEDAWENQYHPSYISSFVYDPHIDNDEDGWSNWSEARYSAVSGESRPDLVASMNVGGSTHYQVPIPTVEVDLHYAGLQPSANIVVHTYTTNSMDGLPDAVFNVAANAAVTKTEPLGYWSDRVISGTLSPGGIVPGTVHYRFTDLWTGAAGDTGFDFDGVLYQGSLLGTFYPIGSIDYVTGRFTIDLGAYAHWYLVDNYEVVDVATLARDEYIDCMLSYIEMTYSTSMPEGWPKKLYLSRADTGFIREGKNYFFAFMDLNGSLDWDAGEPCGVPAPFGADIGWDRNKIAIQLTDYTPNYLRMTLNPAVRSDDIYWGTAGQAAGGGGTAGQAGLATRVRIRRTVVDGWIGYQKIVLDKVIESRGYIHEGDFLAQGEFALDWGLTGAESLDRYAVGYEVFVGNSSVLTNNAMVLTFTNEFKYLPQAKAAGTRPINGAYVYSARPTFRWTMPEGYTAFAIEIRKGSPTGPQVYWSGEKQVPVRDVITGEYIWEAPIHAGDRLKNGQIFSSNTAYAWRVTALNSKYPLGETTDGGCGPCGEPLEGGADVVWSDWKMFRLDVNKPMQSSGYGELRAVVKYYGPGDLLSNRVKVQVFNNRGFTGVPVAQITLTDAQVADMLTPGTTNVNAYLRGLAPSATAGDYYVRAIIDSNANCKRDVWESWGYANYFGTTQASAYDVRPFQVAFSTDTPTATIVIEDADSDQDWFPDIWEYERNPSGDFLALTGPIGVQTAGDTEVNPDLATGGSFWATSVFGTLSMAITDQDDDGLNDMAELLLGTDGSSAWTLADGYSDSDKAALGLAPSDAISLAVTDLGVNVAGAALKWRLAVTLDPLVNRVLLSNLTGVTSDGTVGYVVEYKPTLDAPGWTAVQTGRVTISGERTVNGLIDRSAIDLSKGFFRVRLTK